MDALMVVPSLHSFVVDSLCFQFTVSSVLCPGAGRPRSTRIFFSSALNSVQPAGMVGLGSLLRWYVRFRSVGSSALRMASDLSSSRCRTSLDTALKTQKFTPNNVAPKTSVPLRPIFSKALMRNMMDHFRLVARDQAKKQNNPIENPQEYCAKLNWAVWCVVWCGCK